MKTLFQLQAEFSSVWLAKVSSVQEVKDTGYRAGICLRVEDVLGHDLPDDDRRLYVLTESEALRLAREIRRKFDPAGPADPVVQALGRIEQKLNRLLGLDH